MQFSLGMIPLDEIEQMKHLPESVLPLFWIEETMTLNKSFTNAIKHKVIWLVFEDILYRKLSTYE